jgi:hypothetical protein
VNAAIEVNLTAAEVDAVKVERVFEVCHNTILSFLPDGREKSLVKTKLDEARLWAMEALRKGKS